MTEPDRWVAGTPATSGFPDMGDRKVAGGGGGGGAANPPPSGQTRHRVLSAAIGGGSIRALAKRLQINRTTVQEHLDRLLRDRVLVRRGSVYAPGPAHSAEMGKMGGGGSDRYPPGPATAGGDGLMTDGKRTFTAFGEPSTFPNMPGFMRTSLSGAGRQEVKRRNHLVKWTAGGRTHELVVTHQPTTNAWGIQYLKASPTPRKAELGVEDKEVLWDRFTSQAVQSWAAAAGQKVDPNPRRSREVRLAYPGTAPVGVKVRSENVEIDDTPEPRTVETKREAIAEFIEQGGAVQQFHGKVIAELEARYAHLATDQERLVKVAKMAADVIERSQQTQTETLRAIAAATLPPSTQKQFPLIQIGVEFA